MLFSIKGNIWNLSEENIKTSRSSFLSLFQDYEDIIDLTENKYNLEHFLTFVQDGCVVIKGTNNLYNEFEVEQYVNSSNYFQYLISKINLENFDLQRIERMNSDLRENLLLHLPINLIFHIISLNHEKYKGLIYKFINRIYLQCYPDASPLPNITVKVKKSYNTETVVSHTDDGMFLQIETDNDNNIQNIIIYLSEDYLSLDYTGGFIEFSKGNKLYYSWYRSGKIHIANEGKIRRRWYEEGQIDSYHDEKMRKVWYKCGLLLSEKYFNEHESTETTWYKNGNKMKEYSSYEGGCEQYSEWFPNGEIKRKYATNRTNTSFSFIDERWYIGERKRNYKKIIEENNTRIAEYIEWHKNGNVKFKSQSNGRSIFI